jgi:fluoroquinolone transport system ATP-binding protein
MAKIFEVNNLSFRYPKGREDVIKSISFAVEEGTIFGLLGPSGAGKSTTQKILTKLLTGYQGTITYKGKDLSSYDKSFYENIGVGFEMPIHFGKLTALENLDYFAHLYKNTGDYIELLRKVGLYEARNQSVGEFSKGMKIRLNFVRALLNNPDVIFLDEPTNGLDPKNAKVIKDIILDLKKQGKTIFISTHLMGDVEQLCDQVVFITKGKISDIATPRDLKLKYGKKEVYVEYLNNHERKRQTFSLSNIGTDEEFLSLLKTYDIETIHSGETSMEDIFIRVTGEDKYE